MVAGRGGGPRSICRCYCWGLFRVARPRYQLRARNVAGIRIRSPSHSTSSGAVGPRVTTSRPLLQGCRNEKRQHPTGNCIDARPPFASKSISFYSFEEGTAIIAQLPLSRLASWDECVSRQRASNKKADLFYIYICVIWKIKFYPIIKW